MSQTISEISLKTEADLLALPIGAIVLDRDEDAYIRTDSSDSGFRDYYPHDETEGSYEEPSYIVRYAPLTLSNPEILLPQVKTGDRVVITSQGGFELDDDIVTRHDFPVGAVVVIVRDEPDNDGDLTALGFLPEDEYEDTQYVHPSCFKVLKAGDRVRIIGNSEENSAGRHWFKEGQEGVVIDANADHEGESYLGTVQVKSMFDGGLISQWVRASDLVLVEQWPIEEDLAEWERELLNAPVEEPTPAGPKFKVGDHVRINVAYRSGFDGLRCKVIGSDSNHCLLQPLDARPDTFLPTVEKDPFHKFYWRTENLELIEDISDTIKVGDRVRVIEPGWGDLPLGGLGVVVGREADGFDDELFLDVLLDGTDEPRQGWYASRFELANDTAAPAEPENVGTFEDTDIAYVLDQDALDALPKYSVVHIKTGGYQPFVKTGDGWAVGGVKPSAFRYLEAALTRALNNGAPIAVHYLHQQ